jgi:hypothetical protein
MRSPLESTAWLMARDAPGGPRFVGSCFAFRRGHWLLTAAHCVRDMTPAALGVATHRRQQELRAVEEVIVHPKADVALLRLSEEHALPDRFAGETPTYGWGVPVSAFGYPEDMDETALVPTPRYFRGNLQRMFLFRSRFGYEYEAGELSFGAPAGLSGGPVTPDSDYAMVMGLVAENREASTYLSTISERTTESSSYTERIHSVINYAIAVRLDPLKPWFDEHVPYQGVRV